LIMRYWLLVELGEHALRVSLSVEVWVALRMLQNIQFLI
jgi:hypothetical protein